MSVQPLVQYASRTDVGMRRAANQDALSVRLSTGFDEWATCGHLFVVADGMGGHSVGDLASRITIETLPHAYFKMDTDVLPERLRGAIHSANRAINTKARENPEFADMGTTCSVLTLTPQGAYVGQVGDSRVYRVRNGLIEQLTFDHSLQWEMIRQGRATMENVDLLHPRNVITRCLGPDENVTVDVEGPFSIQKGDAFLLCSDGLTGHVTDSEIGAIVGNLPPAESSRLLIDLANCRGGSDNTTVVITHVQDYPKIDGPVVDPEPATPLTRPTAVIEPASEPKPKRSLMSLLSLLVFVVLSSFGLMFLLTDQRRGLGLVMISAALILGFVRLIVAGTRRQADDDTDFSLSESQRTTLAESQIPEEKSPYRRATAELSLELLEILSETQSDLTQACYDNGWTVDLDELSVLNRQALAALQQNQKGRCLQLRAKAIDLLMRELYAQTRGHRPSARD
ncbi:MAG: protein phosphatase 2C domain-containing protein [Planctomycetaceae bacterium]